MAKNKLSMSPDKIAEVIGTVGSPLIVITELIKNAVDASANEIKVIYNLEENYIAVENDHKGFSLEEIQALHLPGASKKKDGNHILNEKDMYLTGSKGLGLLSVFLLCDEAEIITAPEDEIVYKIILNKTNGTIEDVKTNQKFERHFTRVILKNVSQEVITFLSLKLEINKLRHISTHLYKHEIIPFPKISLHIQGETPREINYYCEIPTMILQAEFYFNKSDNSLYLKCDLPDKLMHNKEICINSFTMENLDAMLLKYYGIKSPRKTRTIEGTSSSLSNLDFSDIPNFEGKFLVYERYMAGTQLRAYGPGVNVYVNDFALYNYLAGDYDWLDLADFTQRRTASHMKPHNVFGYVNFPEFNENEEKLQISNERADFIQDITFKKLMYVIKGVLMYVIINIDVADMNNIFKEKPDLQQDKSKNTKGSGNKGASTNAQEGSGDKAGDKSDTDEEVCSKSHQGKASPQQNEEKKETETYTPENAYKPRHSVRKGLTFTLNEGQIINSLKNVDDLSTKIYNIVFELSKLDLQYHPLSITFLYRTLLESSTKYLSQRQDKINFNFNSLHASIGSAIQFFATIAKKNTPLSPKKIDTWKETVNNRNLINIFNEYVHNETPVDTDFLQETWKTMKGYVMACLTVK